MLGLKRIIRYKLLTNRQVVNFDCENKLLKKRLELSCLTQCKHLVERINRYNYYCNLFSLGGRPEEKFGKRRGIVRKIVRMTDEKNTTFCVCAGRQYLIYRVRRIFGFLSHNTEFSRNDTHQQTADITTLHRCAKTL